jgi:uncharacterized SAM-binding protein YcdF (DUF218 family)
MAAVLKIGYALAHPSILMIQFFLIGAALACFGWWRLARAFSLLGTTLLVVFGLAPTGYLMVRPLEERFAPPPEHRHADGIVVLGGSFDVVVSDYRRRPELNGAADRITTLIHLAHKFPAASIIYADGGAPVEARFKEADAAAALLHSLGLDTTRVNFERNAVNTRENATTALKLAKPRPGDRWLLVTSAWHMPRAMAAFRGVGWNIDPYPVDYLTRGGPPSLAPADIYGGLSLSNAAIKEWVGLAAYYILGWSTEFFPAPEPDYAPD